jgi:hypothetical protein
LAQRNISSIKIGAEKMKKPSEEKDKQQKQKARGNPKAPIDL